jgi:hypothetical protein
VITGSYWMNFEPKSHWIRNWSLPPLPLLLVPTNASDTGGSEPPKSRFQRSSIPPPPEHARAAGTAADDENEKRQARPRISSSRQTTRPVGSRPAYQRKEGTPCRARRGRRLPFPCRHTRAPRRPAGSSLHLHERPSRPATRSSLAAFKIWDGAETPAAGCGGEGELSPTGRHASQGGCRRKPRPTPPSPSRSRGLPAWRRARGTKQIAHTMSRQAGHTTTARRAVGRKQTPCRCNVMSGWERRGFV